MEENIYKCHICKNILTDVKLEDSFKTNALEGWCDECASWMIIPTKASEFSIVGENQFDADVIAKVEEDSDINISFRGDKIYIDGFLEGDKIYEVSYENSSSYAQMIQDAYDYLCNYYALILLRGMKV
jgi:hypothetical protein